MAKPRHPHNRLDTPEELGYGEVEEEEEGVMMGTEGERGGGKHGKEAEYPPPTTESADNNRIIICNTFSADSGIQRRRPRSATPVTTFKYAVQQEGIPDDPAG